MLTVVDSTSLLAGKQTFKIRSDWSLSFTDLQSELKLMGQSSMNQVSYISCLWGLIRGSNIQ